MLECCQPCEQLLSDDISVSCRMIIGKVSSMWYIITLELHRHKDLYLYTLVYTSYMKNCNYSQKVL